MKLLEDLGENKLKKRELKEVDKFLLKSGRT
jgi:hypothetical protein